MCVYSRMYEKPYSIVAGDAGWEPGFLGPKLAGLFVSCATFYVSSNLSLTNTKRYWCLP